MSPEFGEGETVGETVGDGEGDSVGDGEGDSVGETVRVGVAPPPVNTPFKIGVLPILTCTVEPSFTVGTV